MSLINNTSPIRNAVRLTGVMLLILLANPVFAESLPIKFTAHYAIRKGPITFGKTHRTLVYEKDHYVFKSVTEPIGIAKLFTDGEITEQTDWNYHKGGLRPLRYYYRNTGTKKQREVKLVFDWENNNVTNIINGDPWKMELVPGILDKLLYQLAVMADLLDGKRQLEYRVADGGKVKAYAGVILDDEIVKTDLGTYNTIKIRRSDNNKTTTLWCAYKLSFLPVRIQHIKKDGLEVNAWLYAAEGVEQLEAEE